MMRPASVPQARQARRVRDAYERLSRQMDPGTDPALYAWEQVAALREKIVGLLQLDADASIDLHSATTQSLLGALRRTMRNAAEDDALLARLGDAVEAQVRP